MQADEASDANVGTHPLSYHSQNTAIIAESTGEIKGHTAPPPLPVTNDLIGDRPQPCCPGCVHHAGHRPKLARMRSRKASSSWIPANVSRRFPSASNNTNVVFPTP